MQDVMTGQKIHRNNARYRVMARDTEVRCVEPTTGDDVLHGDGLWSWLDAQAAGEGVILKGLAEVYSPLRGKAEVIEVIAYLANGLTEPKYGWMVNRPY